MSKQTGALNHTHRYFQFYSAPEKRHYWGCRLDGCTHYLPGNMPSPLGKMSICWTCHSEFIMTKENMEQKFPVCETCMRDLAKVPEVGPNRAKPH